MLKHVIAALACGALAASSAAFADDAPKSKPAPPKKAPALQVKAIEPNTGDADGGTYVRVVGSGFIDANTTQPIKIYFGARQGTIVRISDNEHIIAQAPGGKIGDKVDVLVAFGGGGEVKLEKAFTFVEVKKPKK